MQRIILNILLIFIQLIFCLRCGKEERIFQKTYNYTVGNCPSELKTGYFNRDESLDVVVLDECSEDITILLNRGDGEFEPAVNPITEEGSALCFEISDFNKDEIDDVILKDYSSIILFLNTGNGKLEPSEIYTIKGFFLSCLIGDFDSDGIQDVVTGGIDPDFGGPSSISLLGKGDGTFSIKTHSGIDCLFLEKTDDLDGDNKKDIICKNWDNYMMVFRGNGDGTFNRWKGYELQGEFSTVQSIDLNNDMYKDVIAAGPQMGWSTFPIHFWSNEMGLGHSFFDLNSEAQNEVDNGFVSIFLNSNGEGLLSPINYNVTRYPFNLVVEDFNNDGNKDLVLLHDLDDTITVLLGKNYTEFNSIQTYKVGEVPVGLVKGDINGDGIQDLATCNYRSNNVSILLGKGDGTFNNAENFDAGIRPVDIVTGDFNGDGKQDLAVANSESDNITILIAK